MPWHVWHAVPCVIRLLIIIISSSRSQSRLGECFVFDEHYIKSKTYWQRLAQRIAVPRVIGASCPQMDVDHGEENAGGQT